MLFYSDIKFDKYSERQLNLQRRYHKLAAEFFQPDLARTPYRLMDIVKDVQSRHFPEITTLPQCIFCRDKTLAFIRPKDSPIRIQISTLLNTPKTPRQVIEHIILHELLHLIVPSREIDGKMVSHPPEFFEREAVLSPESSVVWSWIFGSFGQALKPNVDHECIYVDLVAQRSGWTPCVTWEDAREDLERWNKLRNPCGGGPG